MNIQQIILKILQDNVKTHLGENVPVVIRQFPLDTTPCITIDSEGGRLQIYLMYYKRNYPWMKIIHNMIQIILTSYLLKMYTIRKPLIQLL
ncbi:MAG: hypothetical protein MR750_05410 [Methanobrevibacter boviskoreani]|uniref:hypothetical protein n=1 Tax=Methanobrevibacter boviskoreani TaxID=1348249 RepID=UPI0023A8C03D|nr:hypothetical protein [Methanobrevibacter boviskoreani]MCI6930664.1 hypothetical protein [Methanobrevibacter boviskoreani]